MVPVLLPVRNWRGLWGTLWAISNPVWIIGFCRPLLFLVFSCGSFPPQFVFSSQECINDILLIPWGYVFCTSLGFSRFAPVFPGSRPLPSTQFTWVPPAFPPWVLTGNSGLRAGTLIDFSFFPVVIDHCSLRLNSSVLKTIVWFIVPIFKKISSGWRVNLVTII